MDFIALAQACAPWVAPSTLQAIVRTESAFQPFAIGVNGGSKLQRQPTSKAEAVVTAQWLIARGYNIDLGLGQVNSRNLTKTGLSIDDAFDACKNVAAAASILHWNYQAAKGRVLGEQPALHAALSAYNTGSFTKGLTNGYVQKVVANAATGSMVTSGSLTAQVIPLVNVRPFGPQANKQTAKTVLLPAVVLQARRAVEGASTQADNTQSQGVYERASLLVMVY